MSYMPYDINLSEYEIKVLIPEGVAVSTAEAYRGIVPREGLPPGRSDRLGEQKCLPEDSGASECHENRRIGGQPVNSTGMLMVGGHCQNKIGEPVEPTGMTDLKDVLAMPVAEWKDNLVNDFEATVFKAHPELAAIKQSLYDSCAVYASMSGSGSALFALYKK